MSTLTEARVRLMTELRQSIPQQYLRGEAVLAEVAARWCERHRVWHGPEHLRRMLQEISTMQAGDDREILALAAMYHDAIYDPRAGDNEEASAALLQAQAVDAGSEVIKKAVEIILLSKWGRAPENPLGEAFFALDSYQLSQGCPLHERLAYERAIFREFQWVPWETYREKRREFLQGWAQKFPQHRHGVAGCVELLEGLQPRVAIYPGSFAPFHLGHLSILRQAEAIFDKVIVAVGVNRQKAGAVETAQVRFRELQGQLKFHETVLFDGLLTSLVEHLPFPATVVRGVRDGTDLEAELRFSRFLNELRPGTGVVWISCEAELQHLSSSAIRELEAIAPGAGQRYVPDAAGIYGLISPP